jgi:CBS domain-containing protein
MKVQEILIDNPEVSHLEDQATHLMEEGQVRRLPVPDHDYKRIGIISLSDIAVRTHKEKLAGELLERVSQPVEPAFLL